MIRNQNHHYYGYLYLHSLSSGILQPLPPHPSLQWHWKTTMLKILCNYDYVRKLNLIRSMNIVWWLKLWYILPGSLNRHRWYNDGPSCRDSCLQRTQIIFSQIKRRNHFRHSLSREAKIPLKAWKICKVLSEFCSEIIEPKQWICTVERNRSGRTPKLSWLGSGSVLRVGAAAAPEPFAKCNKTCAPPAPAPALFRFTAMVWYLIVASQTLLKAKKVPNKASCVVLLHCPIC